MVKTNLVALLQVMLLERSGITNTTCRLPPRDTPQYYSSDQQQHLQSYISNSTSDPHWVDLGPSPAQMEMMSSLASPMPCFRLYTISRLFYAFL